MVQAKNSDHLVFYRSMPVSVVVHGILLALLLLVAVPRKLDVPATRVLAVDIVSPDQLAALRAPQPPTPTPQQQRSAIAAAPESTSAPAPASPPSITAAGGQRVQASALHAAQILADPANAELRRNFGRLASSEQLIQLCNIEALEQFGRGEPGPAPDTVVGYAFGDLAVTGLTLVADGGAYRRQGEWFRVRYSCTVRPDMSGITAFDYALGQSVPKSEWEEHFLNADDEGMER